MSLKSMTKSQLIEHATLLEQQYIARGHDIAALREQLAMARPVGYTNKRVVAPRAPHALPPHMAAARAAAMASGVTMLVAA